MLRCPRCSTPPDPLGSWRCVGCEERFDPFESRARCPRCELSARRTRCPSCRAYSPHEDWYADPDVRDAVLASRDAAPARSVLAGLRNALTFLTGDLPAIVKLRNGDYSGVEAVCSRALLKQPTHVTYLYCRGVARAYLGDEDGALSDLTRAIEVKPEFPHTRVYRAEVRIEHEPEESIVDCEQALRLLGEQSDADARELFQARAFRCRACARLRLEPVDSLAALADVDEAMRLTPDDAWTHVLRAEIHTMRRSWEAARADLEQAMASEPNLARAYMVRARIALHSGAGEGLEDLHRAARLAPEDPDMFLARATVHVARGELDEALADLDWALELNPDHPEATNWRGGVRSLLGQPGGQEDLRRAAELEGERATTYALVLMAACHGETSGLEAAPASDEWPHPLARYFRGDLDSQELLDLAEAGDPDGRAERVARARGLLGVEAQRRGETAAAVEHFRACVATGAWVGEAYVARGRLCDPPSRA